MEFEVKKENTYLVEGKVSWKRSPPPIGAEGQIQSATLHILEELGVDTTSETVLWGEPKRTVGEVEMDGKLRTDVNFKKVRYFEHAGTVETKISIKPF